MKAISIVQGRQDVGGLEMVKHGWILVDLEVVWTQFTDKFSVTVRGREEKFLPFCTSGRYNVRPHRKMAFVDIS